MPHYEYFCQGCQKPFTKQQSIQEHDQGNPRCPECGSDKVEQSYSSFYAVTAKKSA